MGIGTFQFGFYIFLFLSAWDIFTGIVGVASAVSGQGVAVQSNLLQLFVDLLFKQPGATILGFVFALVVVFADFYIIEKRKSNYKRWKLILSLSVWILLKWFDFSTTIVGTAKILGLNVPPEAEFGDVWQVVTANSWNQMALLIVLSLVITCSHLGIVLCLDEMKEMRGKS